MALQNEKNSRYLLRDWKPENPAFWENKGKHIARRNLWISVSCLLLAFCVWMLFSAVTVNLNKIGFNFTTDQLFLLTALPSVSGALLRVPYSFMVPIFGGRRWTVFSTAILIIPASGSELPCKIRILLLGYLSLSLCYAVLQVQTLLRAWAISVSSFQKPNKGALLGLMAD